MSTFQNSNPVTKKTNTQQRLPNKSTLQMKSTSTLRSGRANHKEYHLSFADGIVEPHKMSHFDNTGTAIGCSVCNTTKKIQPTMELRYSTCCGYVICTSCFNVELSRGSIPCFTEGCIGKLDRSSWSNQPIDFQRFKKETNKRKDLSNVFCLELQDFNSKQEFDDYQEFVEDIIYDLTNGNESIRNDTEEKVNKFKKNYKFKIDQALARIELMRRKLAGTDMSDDKSKTIIGPKDYIDLTFGRLPPQTVFAKVSSDNDAYISWERRLEHLVIGGRLSQSNMGESSYKDTVDLRSGLFNIPMFSL